MVDVSSIVTSCQAAEAGGVTAIQLRLKEASPLEFLRMTERLLRVLQVPLYINDRADIALAAGAHGVHLGSDDIAPDSVRRFVPPSFRIGISVGSTEEATASHRADVDYWSIGPVFPTSTKQDAGSPLGPHGFKALAARSPKRMPVIAIGGISVANAMEVLEVGAQGLAVSNGIFGDPAIEAAARQLRARVDASVGT
ncbi:MAG: thiamine phosphate synthase [Gemmatimonadales bacterium]